MMPETSILSKHFHADWGRNDRQLSPGERTYQVHAAQHPGWPQWRELIAAAQGVYAELEAAGHEPYCAVCGTGKDT